MVDLQAFSELIGSPKRIVLISHRNPDGDAMGSSLALSYYLQSTGHTTNVVFPSEYPLAFEWMMEADRSIIYDLTHDEAEKAIETAELIICLDFNSLERIDKLSTKVMESKKIKVMIDHHLDPEPFADLYFSVTSASSTCEIVYDMITEMSGIKALTKPIIEALYTGIMTDTGSFHHGTSEKVFNICSLFKNLGLKDTRIQELVLNSQPDKYLHLLGHCLFNRMEIYPQQNFGLIYLTKEDYKKYDIRRGDTEGIINYLMMLKNVKIGALVMNQPSIVKISMRSKGDFSVQEICKQFFNGGGHRNASGGSWKNGLEDCLLKLKAVMGVSETVNS
ncbi:MAG: bifunctional oligoribonuclease/PAP phosphatase NrnA [Saprospiraceae bacterium]|nr:bifunctional oligoribonuclease/PAP phosphatase NrnA [Saprospiraceae bacterium]